MNYPVEFYDGCMARWTSLRVIQDQVWVCYLGPDDQWVTQRKATDDDIEKVEALFARRVRFA
jgi:hypothetical protein